MVTLFVVCAGAVVGVNAGAAEGFSHVNARPQTVGRMKNYFETWHAYFGVVLRQCRWLRYLATECSISTRYKPALCDIADLLLPGLILFYLLLFGSGVIQISWALYKCELSNFFFWITLSLTVRPRLAFVQTEWAVYLYRWSDDKGRLKSAGKCIRFTTCIWPAYLVCIYQVVLEHYLRQLYVWI